MAALCGAVASRPWPGAHAAKGWLISVLGPAFVNMDRQHARRLTIEDAMPSPSTAGTIKGNPSASIRPLYLSCFVHRRKARINSFALFGQTLHLENRENCASGERRSGNNNRIIT